MCGLAGLARFGHGWQGDPDPDGIVDAMIDAVQHRGPDGIARSTAEGPVRLGFARLALVDLATGDQPLVSDDGAVLLIANGEVYNHRELAATLPAGTRLRTQSDCEVLIHLYRERGLRFLDDVRGMFSLVIWDRRAGKLVIARDRFGIKPLYYHRNADRLVFASEIKALFEDPATPRQLDWTAALGDQMVSATPRFSEAPLTSWFADIVFAPAGTIITFDLATGAEDTYQYWQFPPFTPDRSRTAEDFVREYRALLESSVHDCEMADVEIGLFLSGGVDSAAVAALAAGRPRTFSALNASTAANRDAEYSSRIAASLGLDNHQVLFDNRTEPTPEQWLRFVWLLETPLAGPEAFYKYEMYRYVRAATPQIKAMLLGGGADEFNGGYTTQFAEAGWPEFAAAVQTMQLRTAADHSPGLGAWWQPEGSLIRPAKLREVGPAQPADPYEGFVRWKYRDVLLYNCWHEDRTAAGNGIEARVPFLDHRLIELGAAVPPELRPELVWNKQLLRRAVADVLEPEYAQRPKVPFFYGAGVRHTYRAFARMLLADGEQLLQRALSGPGAQEYLAADAMRAAAYGAATQPSAGQLELLLRAVNLGLLEQLVVDLPVHPHRSAAAPIPERIVVDAWNFDTVAALERRVGLVVELDPDTVVSLDESVLLLRGDAGSEWFLAVDGQIEYVMDELEDVAWLSFLRAVDGRHTVAELAGGIEALGELAPLISQATDAGLLHVHLAAPHDLEPIG
jgi:asparagine synthase (glutamine-hydrolysing)